MRAVRKGDNLVVFAFADMIEVQAIERELKLLRKIEVLVIERDRLRSEIERMATEIPQLVRNERRRCIKIVEDAMALAPDYKSRLIERIDKISA